MTIQQTNISTKTIATIILLCGLVGLYFIPHDFLFNSSPTLCIHKRLLGFDCPGCGMTRALYSFIHLDFKTAIYFNFGVLVLFPLFMTEIALGFKYTKGLFKIRTVLYYLLCIALSIIYIERIFNQTTI
jgi:hypothetical protein